MHCTIAEAKARLDMTEVKRWMAWYLKEDRGEKRVSYLLAQISATVMNVMGEANVTPDQLLPWDRQENKQTQAEQKAAVARFFSAKKAALARDAKGK